MMVFIKQIFIIALCFFLFHDDAWAWVCDDESSVQLGNEFVVCGRATGSIEADVRAGALKDAIREFHTLCDASAYCTAKSFHVIPGRADCRVRSGLVTCIRSLTFAETEAAHMSLPLDHSGKIRLGMSKAELLEEFGIPDLVVRVDDRFLILNFESSRFCEKRCSVGLDSDSVYKFNGFKVEFTDFLESPPLWKKFVGAFR